MKLKDKYKWSLLVPTSMGIRITPTAQGQPVHSSENFFMQATSAETNVASVSSYLGMPVKVLTTFVKDSPVARFIKDNLRSRNISFEGKDVEQGGPWGYRHQINIADSGLEAEDLRCGTTVPVKWDARLKHPILILKKSSLMRGYVSCMFQV